MNRVASCAQGEVLLLTVGTGNKDRLRETLLEPLSKSIRQGTWRRVVLLPSQSTQQNADVLKEEIQDVPLEVRPLPEQGNEDDADACFAHFDKVITEVRAAGVSEDKILIDFTRGTKAMSAALVLAAVRHNLPRLRYIVSSNQRDERGLVVPGEELVSEIHTTTMLVRKRLDDALRLFQHGDFAATLLILPDPENPFSQAWPKEIIGFVRQIRPLAEYYGAWDRLDYQTANRVQLPEAPSLPSEWMRFIPTKMMREWVRKLAHPLPDANQTKAKHLRRLLCELLANGERRIRDRQYEDAVLRAYRVLELIGQARLFEYNLDSGSLPPEHDAVKMLQQELIKKKRKPINIGEDGNYQAGREAVARLLRILGDPFGDRLLAMENEAILKPKTRNLSILVHGFQALSMQDDGDIRDLYKRLENLILDDGGFHSELGLQIARSLDFSV